MRIGAAYNEKIIPYHDSICPTIAVVGRPGEPSDPILPEFGILPPDQPPDPGDPGRLGDRLCEDVSDMCMALYEETASALLSDPYVDLIESVEPNCICHGYDPNQEFIGRPAPGRTFEDLVPLPLPPEVNLYHRGVNITANIVSLTADEIRFRIPPDAHTGYVYLRALLPVERGDSRGDAGRLCGFAAPDFPDIPGQGPAALLAIVYPPVLDFVLANGSAEPDVEAEACAPVDLCWLARLEDWPAHLPLPPGASVEVEVNRVPGELLAQAAAPRACVTVRDPADQAFTVTARSLANGQECGAADPVEILIRRAARIHLIPEAPEDSTILAGTGGSFLVRVSCPAPEEGTTVTLRTTGPLQGIP